MAQADDTGDVDGAVEADGIISRLVAAGKWLLDTFRGHAGDRELRDRDR